MNKCEKCKVRNGCTLNARYHDKDEPCAIYEFHHPTQKNPSTHSPKLKKEQQEVTNYNELFNQIEKDIKAKLPDKSRTLISEFVGYRHVELRAEEVEVKMRVEGILIKKDKKGKLTAGRREKNNV